MEDDLLPSVRSRLPRHRWDLSRLADVLRWPARTNKAHRSGENKADSKIVSTFRDDHIVQRRPHFVKSEFYTLLPSSFEIMTSSLSLCAVFMFR